MMMLIVMMAVAACSTRIASRGSVPLANDRAWLVVENHQHDRIRVYALAGESLFPLGNVNALERRALRIPEALKGASPIRVVIDPLGPVPRFATREMRFVTNEIFDLVVEGAPELSTLVQMRY